MRLKLTLFLFLANALVFGLILYRNTAQTQPVQSSGEGILGPEVQDATGVRVSFRNEDAGETARAFTLRNDRWFLEPPLEWPARRDAVERILAQLQFVRPEIQFDVDEIEQAGKTLADYGLDPARIAVEITLPDGRVLEVFVGAPTEIGDRVYVLGADRETVYVTSRDLLSSLAIDLDLVRDPQVFGIPEYEVRQLVMRVTTNGDLTVRLAREDERWQFEAPIEVDADPELVTSTLRWLNSLEAVRFLSREDAPGGGSIVEPRMRVTLEGSRGRETLIIGEALDDNAKTYLAKREDRDALFAVPAEPFDALLAAQRELRERDFLQIQPEQVTSVRMAHNGIETVLQRLENGAWQVLDDAGGDSLMPYAADQVTVDTLLKSFADVRALEFVSDVPTEADLARFGLMPPVWEISIVEAGEPVSLLVGREEMLLDGTPIIYGKRADEPFVYALRPRVTASWILDPLYYRDRTIQRLAAGTRISGIRVERLAADGDDGNQVLLETSIDPLRETWPVHIEAWPTEIQGPFYDLVEMLKNIRVARYLDSGFPAEGLDRGDGIEPWSLKMTYTLALPTGQDSFRTEQRELYFTRRLSGSFQAAGSPWLDATVQLATPMIETLHALFFEREPSELYRPPLPELAEQGAEAEADSGGDSDAAIKAGEDTSNAAGAGSEDGMAAEGADAADETSPDAEPAPETAPDSESVPEPAPAPEPADPQNE